MLSKVLRGEDADSAQPIAWRQTGRSTQPAASSIPAGTKPQSHLSAVQPLTHKQAAGDHDQQQIQALQARINELERTTESRAQQARDAGFREGENAGRAQATAEIQTLLEKLTHSIRESAELRAKLRHEAETDLLTLSLAIAKKVLHREISTDPDALSALVRVALEKVRAQEILRVRIHPQHHAPVQNLLARLGGSAAIDLVPDARMALGGIVIETTRGDFDASIDTQLQEIEHGLADRLKSRT